MAAQDGVDPFAQFRGPGRLGGEGPDGGLQVGHQQGGGNALADHVGDRKREAVRGEPDRVETVAAHSGRGLPAPRSAIIAGEDVPLGE